VERLTMEIQEKMMELREKMSDIPVEDIGDGKAVFLGEMTDAEYDEYDRNVVQGWGKVLSKLGIK